MFHSFITTDRKVYNSHCSALCIRSRVHSILSNDLGRSSFQPIYTDLGKGYSKIEKYQTSLRYLCIHYLTLFLQEFHIFLSKMFVLISVVQCSKVVQRMSVQKQQSVAVAQRDCERGIQKRPPPMSLQLAVGCKPSTSAYCITVLSVN